MAILEGWLPPSRENWELVSFVTILFPIVTFFQWIQPWYGMGKTSVISRFNIPGKIAFFTMELPGPLVFSYIMYTLPSEQGIKQLPWENRVMAGLYILHYIYRAIIYPILAPSISPIHAFAWACAICFQTTNATQLAGWLGGYGPTTRSDWITHSTSYVDGARMELGLMMWATGFLFVLFHDDELREIRRAALRKQKKMAQEADPSTGKGKAGDDGKKGVDKVYVVPKNGFFKWILYPHYLFEWMEWTGFWIMGGWNFVPGRTFVINEISTMLPRAIQGKNWYVERFGKEKVGSRWAVIPGII